jgi:sodium transport system permease protein
MKTMLLKVYIKEIKDCFRDRRTLLLTVLLPIVMMTGLTFFYEKLSSNGEGETFKLAVNQPDDIGIFKGYKNVKLVKTADPKKTLEDGKAQAALILDPNFLEHVNNGDKETVTIFGDSNSQKSSTLMSIVNNALSGFEKSIVTKRLQDKGADPQLIEPFMIQQKGISKEDSNATLLGMLIPLILSIAIGVGSSPAAADLFAGEKERKTMEALLMTPVKRATLLLSKWLTIASVGTITGIITLAVVIVEISLFTKNLKKAFSFHEHTPIIITLAIVITIIYAMFIASLLMMTSIIGKTVKEAQSYSTPVMMLAMFPSMFLSSMGIKELSIQYFAIPIMNLFSLLKELVFNTINYQHIFITILSNLLAMIVLFIIGRILFLKDKWVMN